MIYDGSPSKHLPGLASVIMKMLRANKRCLYLNSPAMVAGMRSCLAAKGLNVAREVDSGTLILSSADNHLIEGRFDTDKMLSLLGAAITQALQDGYSGLWASGDMAWEFGPERNFEKLLAYEQGLEELFRRCPFLHGVCQYHVETLPAGLAETALSVHQACYVNETLSRLNHCYSRDQTQISRNDWKNMLASPRVAAD